MSRVAKSCIELPANIVFKKENCSISIKGPKGVLSYIYNDLVKIEQVDNKLFFHPALPVQKAWAQAGTARAIINNMIIGVTTGYNKVLELVGVGYRVQISNNNLTLSLGFSHPIEYRLPEGVSAEVINNTSVKVQGIDKQLVGQISAEIRAFRPPEPYQGKGIRYAGEVISLKEAKKK